MKNICWIILFLIPASSISQAKPPNFISRILSHNGPVEIYNINISGNVNPVLKINDLPSTYKYSGQALSKNRNGLFLNPLGTGRVYKWEGSPINGTWKRIDSTFFFGYNFNSIFFSCDSTLYSFGGIGYWYINGNIRTYNQTSNEWNAKELNTSIPWVKDARNFFYLDTANETFYFNGQGRYHDASLKNRVDSNTLGKIYKLDFIKNEVLPLGKYEVLRGDFFGATPWGTLFSFNEIADFRKNKYYKVSSKVESKIYSVLAKSRANVLAWQYSFWMDSTLYFASVEKGYDSVIIHQSDLIETNDPVYVKELDDNENNTSSSNNLLWISLLGILAVGNIVIYRKYKKVKRNRHKNALSDTQHEIIVNEKSKLSEVEKNLLRLIFENSILKKLTPINDINSVLGCANKNIEIQKRLRSDAISAVNQKLNFILLTDAKIIDRKRSDFDARSFEYFIDDKYFQQLQKLLN